MYHRLLSLILISLSAFTALSAYGNTSSDVPSDEDCENIVIRQLNYRLRLLPNKDGSGTGLTRGEETLDYIFDARRVGATAIAVAGYGDDLKIAGTSGGKPIYITDYDDGIFFDDAHVCVLPVRVKEPGKPAKATIRRTTEKPEIFYQVICSKFYDIDRAHYEIILPRNLDSRYKIRLVNAPEGISVNRSEKGNDIIYSVDFVNLRHPKRFNDGPSPSLSVPRIEIDGYFTDIDELYREFYSYVCDADPNPGPVAELSRSLTAGLDSDSARIAAITDYVHSNIRYIAVENGELGRRPDHPSEVLAKKFGDCKGSAALLKALLREAGLDGRLVWLGNNSMPYDFSTRISLGLANHMIAAVVLGADSVVLIDGTSTFNPAGRISPSLQGRYCLIEDTPEKGMLYRIPYDPIGFSGTDRRINFTLNDKGDAEVSGQITLTGSPNFNLLGMDANTTPNRRPDLYHAVFAEAVPKSKPLAPATFSPGTLQSTINGSATSSGIATISGSQAYLDLNPFPAVRKLQFDTEGRAVDGRLGFPLTKVSVYSCTLPMGWSVAEMPDDCTISTPWLEAVLTNTVDGGTLTRTLTLRYTGVDVPLSEIQNFNAQINRLARACNAKTVLDIR